LTELLRQDGILVKDETLLVTAGCQKALDLIAARCAPGHTVVMN
jgi:DNA-binding transcriptional MocR family regulator